jgi:hypothetical protein
MCGNSLLLMAFVELKALSAAVPFFGFGWANLVLAESRHFSSGFCPAKE